MCGRPSEVVVMESLLFGIRAQCVCCDLEPSLPTVLAASLKEFIQV